MIRNNIHFILLFLCVSSSFSLILILWFLFILYLSEFFKNKKNKSLFFFYLLISILFLYPTSSLFQNKLSGYFFILYLISYIFYFKYPYKISYLFKNNNFIKNYFLLYFALSVIIYSIHLFHLYFELKLIFNIPSNLGITKFQETSLSLLFILIPIISLKKLYDFESLFYFFTKIIIVYIFFSFLNFYTDINIFSYSLTDYDANRFHGINDPTALSLPRLVYFPLTLFSVYYMFNGNKNYLILSTLVIIMILLSLSRTSYIVLIFLFILVFFTNKKISIKNIIPFFIFPILIILLFILLGLDESFISNEGGRGSLGNLEVRANLWLYGLKILSTSPIFGTFPGNYFEGLISLGYDYTLMSIHSFYLQVAVEWGLLLGVLLIFFPLITIYLTYKNLRLLKFYNDDQNILKIFTISCGIVSIIYYLHGITEVIPLLFIFIPLGINISINNFIIDK